MALEITDATFDEVVLKSEKPDVLSIEDLFFVQNVTTGIQVAQARGVILLAAQKFGKNFPVNCFHWKFFCSIFP